MKKYLSFIAIFRTNFVANNFVKIVSHPVKIEIFSGIRKYQIPSQAAYRFPKNEETNLATVETLILKDSKYIEIKIRTNIKNENKARVYCESKIDKTVAMLVSIYNIHLLDMPIYRGWIVENNWGILGGWVQTIDEQKFEIESREVETELTQIQRNLLENDDWEDRFTIMARFFSKALTYDHGEEKFLLLWTALEVFPMKDTTNIAPISTCLGNILGRPEKFIKDYLEIGQLYRIRCSLVHHGQFRVNEIDSVSRHDQTKELHFNYQTSDTIARLEYIVREIMRYMCGLPYSGSLDQYLPEI